MALIDNMLYNMNMNQSVYDGVLFGGALTSVCYLIDWIMYSNSYMAVVKPIVATVIYAWLY